MIANFMVLAAFAAESASAQTIVNTSSTGGQTNWLETFATGGESSNSANVGRVSVLVRHAAARRVTGLKIDDNYDGTDNTSSETTVAVTPQRPNLNGGYGYSRVTFQYSMPTSGTGMSCPVIGTRTRRTTKPLRIRAVLDDGTLTGSTSSDIRFTATGQCLGSEDFPYIYSRSQSATSIETGNQVTFTYTGDDPDVTGNADFQGIRWRARRLSDGATTAVQTSCPGNGDNNAKTLNVTFPNRGRWVVEAELLNNDGCGTNDNPGYWFYIGAVDVNAPASASPTIDLSATRPQINGNTTISASVADPSDSSAGGVAEAIEWDLDGNTSNGVNGYEETSLGDHATGLTAAQKTRTINTTGMSPGLHTIRARVGDNGALGGADNIRRTKTDTTTFLVDTPPVVNGQSVSTETENPLPIDLGGSDVDGDTLTYTITTPPSHGDLSGSGRNQTYTSDAGYAGSDSFVVRVSDGYGGTASATVNVRVDPSTKIDSAPSGTVATRAASFEFSSLADDAAFQCSLDGSAFAACDTPLGYTDLDDGSHTFRVRALAAGNTDQSPASATFTVDASPVVNITAEPPAETDSTDVTFAFATSEAGATVAPTTECKLDDGDFRPCDSPITYTDLDDGDHDFTVRATDAYGKQATDTRTWAIDAVGSNTLIDSAPPARIGTDATTIEFSSPDEFAVFQCSFDGSAYEPCTSPAQFSGLSEGPHTFRARAIDLAGIADPTPATVRFRVDLTAPESQITSGPGGLTNDATPTFEFTANELDSTFECRLDAGAWEACSSPLTPAALAEGDHELAVRATDTVQNVESDPSTRSFRVDLTAPATQISTGPTEGSTISTPSATFGFESPDPDATAFRCSIDESAFVPCQSASSQTYQGLADGEHTFSVKALDGAGNQDPDPPARSFRVDTQPPQTSIEAGPAAVERSQQATFGFQADEADATFECSLDGGPYEACSSPQTYSGLGAGRHEFQVRAIDPHGNTDLSPATRSWTVDLSAEPLPDRPGKPKKACYFERDLPRCGDPFMRARATALPVGRDRKSGGFGKVVLKANGAGSALTRVRFAIPPQLHLRFDGDRDSKVGLLELFGFSERRAFDLRGEGADAGRRPNDPTVRMDGSKRLITVDDLPGRVRRVRLVLSSPSLTVESEGCGTRTWEARLYDRKENRADVSTLSDVRCPKGGGR